MGVWLEFTDHKQVGVFPQRREKGNSSCFAKFGVEAESTAEDWSQVNKKAYLEAMTESPVDSTKIRELLYKALTDKINDREMFMKGIDYSYYYENDDISLDPTSNEQ